DLGADVVRIDRKTVARGRSLDIFVQDHTDTTGRGRRSIALDLKSPAGIETVLALIERADALIDVFRPGVMERLGLGPDVCLARNPRLVYGRMTGWGQTGPLAKAAGHDMNYIAITGIQHSIGPKEGPPSPPLNLVGDYAGALGLAFGLLAGIYEAKGSGKGQVVDAAMCDISSLLMARIWGLRAQGFWKDERGTNTLDGGAHFYTTYQCADGKWISVAPIEAQFYAELLKRAGIDDEAFKHQWDRALWPDLKARMARHFKTRTRDEWCALLEGSDACFAPVLDMGEALEHPHMRAREAFIEMAGVPQPAPAPRFSRTPPAVRRGPPRPGEHAEEILTDWGFEASAIAALRADGTI
ncbi:MAG: CoA transferase, partial [Hyphomicrobiaceae bacterium]|nr:CoA transferase [Hyphomicrobiaceae bacterium]